MFGLALLEQRHLAGVNEKNTFASFSFQIFFPKFFNPLFILKLISEPGLDYPRLHWTFTEINKFDSTSQKQIDTLRPGDCVLVRSDNKDQFDHIAVITNFWSDSTFGIEDIKASVNWYYRGKEVLDELNKKRGDLMAPQKTSLSRSTTPDPTSSNSYSNSNSKYNTSDLQID